MIRFLVQVLLEAAVGGQTAGPVEYVLMAMIAVALLLIAAALVWPRQPGPREPVPPGRRVENLLSCCVAVLALVIALHGVWAAIVAFVALAAFTLKLHTSPRRLSRGTDHEDEGDRAERARR